MGWREWVLLVALSVLWGGSFFFVGVAVADVPPLTIVAGRVGLAALALLAAVHVAGQRMPLEPGPLAAFAAMGVLNGLVPYSLITWGQTRLDSGSAAILNATTPLFSVVLAHALAGTERLTPQRLAGVLLGLGGVVVLIGPAALGGMEGQLPAALAVLGAALSYALAAIWGRLRLQAMAPMVAAAGQIAATALLAVPASLVIDRPWTLVPAAASLAAIAGLALISTALAYLLYFRILAAAGATNVLLVTFLIPLSAMGLGVLFLGERPGAGAFAAMALIFAGIALVDGRLARRWRRGASAPRVSHHSDVTR